MTSETEISIPLEDNESMIWHGSPGRTTAPKGKSVTMVLTGGIVGAALLWFHFIRTGGGPAWLPEEFIKFFEVGVVNFVFTLLSVAFLLYPVIIHWILQRTVYCVTDKRIMVLPVASPAEASNIPAAKIRKASYYYSDLEFVRVIPYTEALSHLNLRERRGDTKSGGTPERHVVSIMYLPTQVAEYVQSRFDAED